MISVLIVVLHILAALALILIVLLQVGKGQSIGAAFGGAGSSQTFFGSRGPATFLSQMTTVAAALFMVTSLALAYMSSRARQGSSLTDQVPITESVPPPPTQPLESIPAPPTQPLESVPTPTPPAEQQR